MNSPAHDIAKHLADLGPFGTLGALTGWSINVAGEPANPDTTITIYDTPGLDPDTDELTPTQPGFQVRVRSKDYPEAYSMQRAIRDALIFGQVIADSSIFTLITLTSDIFSIGVDGDNRHLLVANYRSRRILKEN